MSDLFPYATHDLNRRVHITSTGERALCGVSRGHYAVPFTDRPLNPTIVDEQWLSQPDPDNLICKKCHAAASKIINRKKKGAHNG